MTFYNNNGSPIAYTDDGESIFLFSGEPVAYISKDTIYSYSGKVLGWFENGWIWDLDGYCVFYSSDASGGPMKPMMHMVPMKHMKRMKPMKHMKQMKPMKHMKHSSWSDLSGEQFFDK